MGEAGVRGGHAVPPQIMESNRENEMRDAMRGLLGGSKRVSKRGETRETAVTTVRSPNHKRRPA